MTLNFTHHPVPGGRPGRWRAWLGTLRCRGFLWGLVAGLMVAGGNLKAAGEDAVPVDFQVKAAFLVNFPKYVDWPDAVFAEAGSPITVAIFGDDNVANEFQTMIENGRTVGGRPLVLKRINKEDEITGDCQILYLGASVRQRAGAILAKLAGTKILTVGEGDNFLENGGVINLARQGRKIRLQVNLAAAETAQLKISSRLLAVADVVKGKPN